MQQSHSDKKTWILHKNIWHYPDVTVFAKPPQFYVTPTGKLRRDAIVNRLLLVEVLSNKTRAFDLDENFNDYCTLPSFREYLLVEPEKIWVKTIFIENPATGLQKTKTVTRLDTSIYLHSLDLEIPLAEIYKPLELLK